MVAGFFNFDVEIVQCLVLVDHLFVDFLILAPLKVKEKKMRKLYGRKEIIEKGTLEVQGIFEDVLRNRERIWELGPGVIESVINEYYKNMNEVCSFSMEAKAKNEVLYELPGVSSFLTNFGEFQKTVNSIFQIQSSQRAASLHSQFENSQRKEKAKCQIDAERSETEAKISFEFEGNFRPLAQQVPVTPGNKAFPFESIQTSFNLVEKQTRYPSHSSLSFIANNRPSPKCIRKEQEKIMANDLFISQTPRSEFIISPYPHCSFSQMHFIGAGKHSELTQKFQETLDRVNENQMKKAKLYDSIMQLTSSSSENQSAALSQTLNVQEELNERKSTPFAFVINEAPNESSSNQSPLSLDKHEISQTSLINASRQNFDYSDKKKRPNPLFLQDLEINFSASQEQGRVPGFQDLSYVKNMKSYVEKILENPINYSTPKQSAMKCSKTLFCENASTCPSNAPSPDAKEI